MKLTKQQAEIYEKMKTRNWRIRHARAYGKYETYFWDDPLHNKVHEKVFMGLVQKLLITPDTSNRLDLWKIMRD